MHFYWRVIEELRYLGEVVNFQDPSLLREYRRWLRERPGAIPAGSHTSPKPLPPGTRTLFGGLN